MEGSPLRLIDTAGVRDSEDLIEIEGVERAKSKISSADLVLLLIDGSQPLVHDDFRALELCADCRRILVVNKEDLGEKPLPEPFLNLPSVKLSARTGSGIQNLQNLIVEQFSSFKGVDTGDFVLSLFPATKRGSFPNPFRVLLDLKKGLRKTCLLNVLLLT